MGMTQTRHYTFGPGHKHPDTGKSLGGQYVTVTTETEGYDACRARMFRYWGNGWAFEYETLPAAISGPVAEWPREQYDRARLGAGVCEWMDAADPDMAPAKPSRAVDMPVKTHPRLPEVPSLPTMPRADEGRPDHIHFQP
jgi:hypothetical protein